MNFQRSIFLGVKNEFSIQNQGISGESTVDQVIYKWVKDSAGPCDCIKDSDGSRPVKKTRIDFTPALILCL